MSENEIQSSQEFYPYALERETAATLIEEFQLSTVFGLLQTRNYTKQLLTLLGYSDPALLQLNHDDRANRQLAFASKSKRFRFVMSEAVLRSGAFSKEVMFEQLDKFEEVNALPNVDIRFVPLARMVSIHSLLSFSMFDRNLTVIEGLDQSFLLKGDSANKVYADLFDKLYRDAVSLEYLLSMPSQKVYQPLAQF
jgi:hypothetical protein